MKLNYKYLLFIQCVTLISAGLVIPQAQGAFDTASMNPRVWTNNPEETTGKPGTNAHRTTIKARERINDFTPFSPGSNNVALDVGQVFLMGDLTRFSDSIGTQLHYTYGVSDLFSFDSSFGYSQHSDGKFSMATLQAGIRMNMSWYDKVIPYLVFGLGFYRPSYQDWTLPTSAGTTNSNLSAILFGIHAGPGIDLEISHMVYFGAALTFNTVFGTTQALNNGALLNLGGTFATFLLHAGVTF